MKNIFFPDGNSNFGKLKEMLCFLGNYHQKMIDKDNFNLINYIQKKQIYKSITVFGHQKQVNITN